MSNALSTFLLVWGIGMLASLVITGYMCGKDAIVGMFQSTYNNSLPLGWQALTLAVVFPVHFVQLIVWEMNKDRYSVRGPFDWFPSPPMAPTNDQVGSDA